MFLASRQHFLLDLWVLRLAEGVLVAAAVLLVLEAHVADEVADEAHGQELVRGGEAAGEKLAGGIFDV